MISHLTIENFALIEKLSIDFSQGFTIITGETGAGKSILLGALGLVLGKRADLTSLKNKEEKCIVEAHFNLKPYGLQSFFERNDFDYDDDTIIRREILPSGKSRAFVNDSPVNVQDLQELGAFLIDIHSQHQTLSLSEEEFQFNIIDAIGANDELLSDYRQKLKTYKHSKSELSSLQENLLQTLKEHDYNVFLLDELVSANLKAGEQQELEEIYEQLNNVEFIREHLDRSIALANEEQIGILGNLREMRHSLQKLSGFSEHFGQLSERLDSAAIELDDIASEMERAVRNLNQDPEQLESVNQKLQAIYNLQKKHGVQTVEELLEIQSELQSKTLSAEEIESRIEQLRSEISDLETQLDAVAEQIHIKREKAIPVLDKKLADILAQLGMPDARFQIQVVLSSDYHTNGKDDLQFLFAANKGSQFGSLKKVASGGEMSRIMLAVKSVLAEYSNLPTIIFDEIDTGVSGEIAHKMAEIMAGMSKKMQVFAITHLPQIAAKGDRHFKVYKSSKGDNTTSEIKLLDKERRIVEIAQMLSGSVVSDSAINHAKALLN
ncbi:DNA repair protein RecN [Flavobacterium sp. MAH-1]|uniref:DNA repair protein RecN n=1 Tax=Flavobacterium agri TaxID=2743471 RepID=A0A7Y8Y6W4_9FLAO|nr:DNA repair protein RecN [Flavobacterium agri]NUY82266.1 DNA repair protein RecN [Flavobacterium agri]NYA72290.1 DNA repair protein RecN [Flavobacterium agri]